MTKVKNKFIVKGPNGDKIATSNEVVSELEAGKVTAKKEQKYEEFFVGGTQEYTCEITNSLATPLASCTFEDVLDPAIVYTDGSFEFDGVAVTPEYDTATNTLRYTILSWLPGVSHTITFQVQAAV